MTCGKLAVEQPRPGLAQRRHQPGQGHFRRIALPAEHAFPAKHAGKAHAIEPTRQLPRAVCPDRPGLDRMGMAQGMERAVAFADALRNPAVLRPVTRRGARIDHCVEGRVAGHGKPLPPQRARQGSRAVKPVERQNRAQPWLHPIDLGIVPTIGHRKDSGAIGPQQQVGRDQGCGRWQHVGRKSSSAGCTARVNPLRARHRTGA